MSKKTILVTGVSRGLGRALTDGFIKAGHTVIGTARSKAAIVELNSVYGTPHRFDVVDQSDPVRVNTWTDSVLTDQGAPDFLINNASVINKNALLWDISEDNFSQLIDINVKGVFYICRAFLPAMIERGSGVVVNLSSGWGRSVAAEVAPYCASKWAIEGLTQALAEELPSGLAAVPLNPGVINTDMLQSCFGDGANNYRNADQWAETAVPFLLKINSADNGKALTAP